MSTLLIPTGEELRVLSKMELRIYEMYRLKGRTKEQICEEMHITRETFRGHWSRAQNKLRRQRLMTENPQYQLAKGNDVLRNDFMTQQYVQVPSKSMKNINLNAALPEEEKKEEAK